jgi:hypothetical protein
MTQELKVQEKASMGRSCLYCVHLKTEETRKVVMDLSRFRKPELFNKFAMLYKCEVDNSLCESSDWLCEAFHERNFREELFASSIDDVLHDELKEFMR